MNSEPVNQFKHVRRALHAYFSHEASFNSFVSKIMVLSNRDGVPVADAWFARQDYLRLQAGIEFVKVTPNARDKAHFVDPWFMARCSGFDYRRYDPDGNSIRNPWDQNRARAPEVPLTDRLGGWH